MNDGKPLASGRGVGGGHSWTPVFDGDLPEHDNLGVGWVQVGAPSQEEHSNKTGMNHKEGYGGDCDWGEASDHGDHKGPCMWCVIDGAPLVALALATDEISKKLLGIVAAKFPKLIVPASIVARSNSSGMKARRVNTPSSSPC